MEDPCLEIAKWKLVDPYQNYRLVGHWYLKSEAFEVLEDQMLTLMMEVLPEFHKVLAWTLADQEERLRLVVQHLDLQAFCLLEDQNYYS